MRQPSGSETDETQEAQATEAKVPSRQTAAVPRDAFGRLLPGHGSLNPGGRRGPQLTTALAAYMDRPIEDILSMTQDELRRLPAKEALAVIQIRSAVSDRQAREYTYDRVDGRPAQALIHSESDEQQRAFLAEIAKRLAGRIGDES